MEIRDAFVIALDETPKEGSLALHDKAYHPHGYHKGDECKFRDQLAHELEGDDVGLEDANNQNDSNENESRQSEQMGVAKVFTGSKRDYAKPSLEYVGSGVGVNAKGHGLYGTTSREAASKYTEWGNEDTEDVVLVGVNNDAKIVRPSDIQLTDDKSKGQYLALSTLCLQGSKSNALDFIQSLPDSPVKTEAINYLESNQCKAFKRRLPPKGDKGVVMEQTFFTDRQAWDKSHLLNWDQSVPQAVRERVNEEVLKEYPEIKDNEEYNILESMNGDDFYYRIKDAIYEECGDEDQANKEAARILVTAGIDGVQYEEGGATNYVSFRDDNIRVDRKWVDGQKVYDYQELVNANQDLDPQDVLEHLSKLKSADEMSAEFARILETGKIEQDNAPNGEVAEQSADIPAEQPQPHEQQSQPKTEPRIAKDLSEDFALASKRLRDLGYTEMVDTAEQRLRDIIGGDGYEGREYERAVAAAVAKKLLEPEKDNFPFIYRELDTLDAYGVSDSDIRSAARTLSNFFFGLQEDWELRLEDVFDGKTPPDTQVTSIIDRYLKPEHPVRQKISQMHQDYEREQAAKREHDAFIKRTAYNGAHEAVDGRIAELVSTKPEGYTPNPQMTADEIRQIGKEHRAYWDKVVDTGTDMGSYEGREFITQRLFDTLGAAESHGADENLVGELMPDVQMSDDVGLAKGSFNPYTTNTNMSGGDNCWKGVVAGLMRMRGFNVSARKADESSPILSDSGNAQVAEGKQIPVYLHSMQKMTEAYERISGSGDEVRHKFAQMAHGDEQNGIAPYPDGTFVMTWDGHARGTFLYKGKWFSFDPFGLDDLRTQKEGITDAPYIKPISPEKMGEFANSGSREEEESEIGAVVTQLIQERLFSGNPTYMFPPSDRRRQVILALMHEGRQDGLYLTGKGRHSGPPDRDVLDRVIKRLVQKGTLRKFSSSIVIRPQDPLIKEILGLVKAGRSRDA